MRRPALSALAILVLAACDNTTQPEVKSGTITVNASQSGSVLAFPTAEGFGRLAEGGRGGEVYVVSNLNDAGSGSLRECVEAGGPRTCVFGVAGTITLNSELAITNPYITIAGQTAPGGGITLKSASSSSTVHLEVKAHDVIVRYIRSRPGTKVENGRALTVSNFDSPPYNVIIDHVSMSWAGDEIFISWYDANNITVQWSSLSESLPAGDGGYKGPNLGDGGGSGWLSLHHNLLAHHNQRFPLTRTGEGPIDLVNNVMYNLGSHGHANLREATKANLVSNYIKPGPNSTIDIFVQDDEITSGGYYHSGNVVEPGWSVEYFSPDNHRVSSRYDAPTITTTIAELAFEDVLANAGAVHGLNCDGTRFSRPDDVDERIASSVRDGTRGHNIPPSQTERQLGFISDPSDVGGWPELDPGTPCTDSDKDGMPDLWEEANGLDPNVDDSAQDMDGDGYTNLEAYLNGTSVGSPGQPIADFTWTEDPFLTVAFTDASSDPDGTLTGWSWDFGDGVTSTEQSPTHVYDAAGTHTVTLAVTDDEGLVGMKSKSLTAGPQAPSADFTWAATELVVDFTDASSDADGTLTDWSWDFGDGATSTAQNPSHTYAADGSYPVTLTVTDDDGLTGTTSQTVSAATRTDDVIYVTSTGDGVVGGVSFEDQDILAYDGPTDTWSIHFDGSDVGLNTSKEDIRAFELLADGDILLRVNKATTLPDVGNVDPSDIVRFSGSTGSNTSGTFSLYLRGADIGLAREEIDAIGFAPDGRLVLSTEGSFSVPGASGEDEDLIALDPGGASWSLYFDGSDVGLGDSSDEDVAGVWIDDITGDIYLTTKGAFSVPDVSGDSSAVLVCKPIALGSQTSCSFESYWAGSLHGLGDDVVGLHIRAASASGNQAPTASFTWTATDLSADFNDTSTDSDGTIGSWSWDFGDGATSIAQNPSHTYGSGGNYTVTLTVTDDDGATGSTSQIVTVTEPANTAPNADFTFTTTDLTASFTDASTDSDGTIAAWSWDFGDGGTSTAQNPSHAYASAGDYMVTLTVTDDDGATGTTSQSVTVTEPANTAPNADFTFTTTDLTASFTDASTDSDGTIAAWSWDFGDGATSTAQNPSHTYASAGDYTVTLTVTDDDGATGTTSQSVTVTEPANTAPTADFTFTTTDLTASLTDASTDSDGTIAAWSWDFGDGATSSAQNPSHTYASAGDYTVTLTVTDDDGATGTASQLVSVTAPSNVVQVVTPAGSEGYVTSGGRSSDQHLEVTVTLVDGAGAPVQGADVSVMISGPTPLEGTNTATTNELGQATFKITNAVAGTYTTEVIDVIAAGLTWDGETPPNSFEKS